jgi:hypothetical protein
VSRRCSNHQYAVLPIAFVIGTLFVAPARALAQEITFTKVIDTDTYIPGSAETFACFSPASLSLGNVAFMA